MPPQKSEVPRTNSRFDSMEPKSEYFTTSTLCCHSAKIAIISSVALPHVAFSSPPTAKTKIYKKELNSWLLKFPSIILRFPYKYVWYYYYKPNSSKVFHVHGLYNLIQVHQCWLDIYWLRVLICKADKAN